MIQKGFLNGKERAALQALLCAPSQSHRVTRRTKAILLLDDGLSCVKVGEVLHLHNDTVRGWLKRYRAGGLNEMTAFHWHGPSGHLSREQEAELSAHLSEQLYHDSNKVAAYIAATWGVTYSRGGCLKLLGRLGFIYERTEAQSDPALGWVKSSDKVALKRTLPIRLTPTPTTCSVLSDGGQR